MISELTVKNIVIGSGAAGLSAALRLWELGEKDTAVITEGMNSGTSRNTGSDKQTYYKLSLSGGDPDSILDVAEDIYGGGAVDGDTALVEAAYSARCFFKLVSSEYLFRRMNSGNIPVTRQIMTKEGELPAQARIRQNL